MRNAPTPAYLDLIEFSKAVHSRTPADCRNGNRWGYRDATMISGAYRRGLRVSTLGWKWISAVDRARPQGQAGHAEHPSDPRG